MSFYDAQACGLPVLSEDNNVNVDRCSYDNGFNFRQGDIEDFRAKIIEAAGLSEDTIRQMGKNACSFINNGYDYQSIAQQYTNYLLKALDDFRKKEDRL
jgi:glycosyltransferase involved in cell wall biosynthesis